ncbi:MAG: SGNH/GDSL hydrolase family protein [Alphaproteobacteria bacterium]|nr:SGNH/GDSL hydrolase family protein [Alphaproteobacteria bacterium]
MTHHLSIGRLTAAFAGVLTSLCPALAEQPGTVGVPSCAVSPALSEIGVALDRSARRIDQGSPLTIVAMGSSSTLGVGASAPSMTYPSRLDRELRDRFPAVEIRVLNRGIGGQDVGEELNRLDRDVVAEHPDLVIWQVGTNAVLRRDDLTVDEQLIRQGVSLMKEVGIDVVLMDLQYARRVLTRPSWGEMERVIGEIARSDHVGLFRRFEIMKEWDHTQQLAPAPMIGPDGLHMTDASYGCLASELAEALAWNWWSHGKIAKSLHQSPDAVSRLSQPVTRPLSTALRTQ